VLETDTLKAVQQSPGLLRQKDRGVNTSEGRKEGTKKRKGRKIILLGSSHGMVMGQMFQENLGSKFEVCSISKQNAPLGNVVEDVIKIGKDLTKQDPIVIVIEFGNSLDINQDYSIDEDLNFTAERTSNTNVVFVNLLRRYGKPWMNGRVRV
jgi:hypothetical protein